MKYGVVGVQGDIAEHEAAAHAAGDSLGVDVDTVRVTTPEDTVDCDVLALPGGESTTISRHIERDGLAPEIRRHVERGNPLLATCAGLIVSSSSAGDDRVTSLDLVDVEVERNAFGRQKESFEADVEVAGLDEPYPGVFIRAPVVESVGDADVIAELDGSVVGVRGGPSDNVVATSFHPELTDDSRVHEMVFEDA